MVCSKAVRSVWAPGVATFPTGIKVDSKVVRSSLTWWMSHWSVIRIRILPLKQTGSGSYLWRRLDPTLEKYQFPVTQYKNKIQPLKKEKKEKNGSGGSNRKKTTRIRNTGIDINFNSVPTDTLAAGGALLPPATGELPGTGGRALVHRTFVNSSAKVQVAMEIKFLKVWKKSHKKAYWLHRKRSWTNARWTKVRPPWYTPEPLPRPGSTGT